MSDYAFPTEWPHYSPSQKAEWYLYARVRWQMSLQHDAGMWDQFDDVDGICRLEAERKIARR